MKIPRSAQEVLRQRFQLEAALGSCPSPTGSMQSPRVPPRPRAEVLLSGTAGPPVVAAPPRSEPPVRLGASGGCGGYIDLPARERLALLVLLTRDLTPLEEDVCRLRYAGPAGGYARHEGVVRSADAQLRQLVPDALPELLTREGDVVTSVVRDEQGALTDFLAVEGVRAKPMGWAAIADHLRLTDGRDACRAAGDAIVKTSKRLQAVKREDND